MCDNSRRPVAQLTTHELDLYGNQLTRCLKALSTEAPIRADVQHELATVRAEQESRTAGSEPHHTSRPYDVSGQTAAELQRSRRDLVANLALARPDSPSRVPILAHLDAIDAELTGRAAVPSDQSSGFPLSRS
jgi:hypothetical protein